MTKRPEAQATDGDAVLLARFAAGDHSAARELTDGLLPRAMRQAWRMLGDQIEAEDVAQEALVKAWLALPTFRGDASLRSWLLRITHNTAISTLRRRRAVVIDPQEMPEQQTRVERSVFWREGLRNRADGASCVRES